MTGINFSLLLLYASVLIGITLFLAELLKFFKLVGLPQILSSTLLCVTLIYVSALVPGIFGVLTASNTYAFLLVLLILTYFSFRALVRASAEKSLGVISQAPPITFSRTDWAVIGLGVILSAPLISYVKGLPFGLFDSRPILGWDVVSYHLPGVIEFYQNKTLWSLSGPYQSYSFGYELLGNYFSQIFFASWGLMFAHLLALFLAISAIVSVSKSLQYSLRSEDTQWFASSILSIGIWSALAHQSIGAVGKNDIFMGAAVLSSLAFILILNSDRRALNLKTYITVLLIGLGLGLAIGVKPSSIAFLPYFWLAIFLTLVIQKRAMKVALSLSIMSIATAVVIGGFWLTRNLIIFDRLSPVLDSGWQSSVIANLLNKDLYRAAIHHPGLLLASMAWIPALILANRKKNDVESSAAWWLISSFHLTACLVFAITPFAFQGGGLEVRLGMPLLLSAAIIYGILLRYIMQRFIVFSKPQWLPLVLVLVTMFAVPFYWSLNKQGNLFGYDQVFPLPRPKPLVKTNIYTWVQGQQEPLRIYSAGLRPYGLYGRNWGNTLFYDLHSSTLLSGPDGKKRIAAVVDQFSPDVILISLAPHSNSPVGVRPEVISWMKTRADLFSEIYLDELVDGFKVHPQAKEILVKEFPEKYLLKMGE